MGIEHDDMESAIAAVEETLENFDCQPILFIGAGLARRYIGAPDWEGALRYALSVAGKDGPDYSYLVQKHNDDKVAIEPRLATCCLSGLGQLEKENLTKRCMLRKIVTFFSRP